MFQDIIEFNKKKEFNEIAIEKNLTKNNSDRELIKIENEKEPIININNINKNEKIFPPFFTIHYISKFSTAKIIYSEMSKKRIHISNGSPLGFIGDFDIFKRLYQINFNTHEILDKTENLNCLNNNNNAKLISLETDLDNKEDYKYLS